MRFLEFIDELGFPSPQTNQWIEGFEVDCVWREQRLAVELDGRSYHDTLQAYERDRERDRLLQAAGWRPVRVTWRQLERSRAGLERDLRRSWVERLPSCMRRFGRGQKGSRGIPNYWNE